MCGICGIFEYGTSWGQVTDELVVRMRDVMTHRGPDDAGCYVSPDRRVGFGHRRLSIVDLSPAGRNPMPNEDGTIWITFNGEIYNHASIRERLVGRGHRYRSRTDTETVVHLYEDAGLDFVQDLDGFFAIGLWDGIEKRLVLVRDRAGKKPLYYAVTGGRLIFASEIKALLAHPAISRDLDQEALFHYLTFLTTPPPRTMFEGISKLAPGSMLVCGNDGAISITRYWDATPKGAGPVLSEEEAASEAARLLGDAVRKRTMSDVPFGVFLSGGIDSSATVALLSQAVDTPVRTFTVGFKGAPEHDETAEARFVADRYATDHHEILIDETDLINFLPGLVFHQDEPIADPVCVPLFYLSKLARDTGTKVILIGEGADELFCGYRDYALYLKLNRYLWQPAFMLPGPLRKGLASALTLGFNAGGSHLLSIGRKAFPDLLRRMAAGEELFWSGSLTFDEYHKSKLLQPAFRQALRSAIGNGPPSSYSVVQADLQRLLATRPDADQLERMTYQELKLRLPELLLMRADKITMAASIEARVPFLDYKLIEFAMGLPMRLKYRRGQKKYILKRALRGLLPDRVLDRPKKGFGVPLNRWTLDRLGALIEDRLMNSRLRQRNIFDYSFISWLLEQHRQKKEDYSFFLWSLFNLTLWYDHWIEGEAEPSWPAAPTPGVDSRVQREAT